LDTRPVARGGALRSASGMDWKRDLADFGGNRAGGPRQAPGRPRTLVLAPWTTGVITSTGVQVVRNAKLLHCHWSPRTALDTGCGDTTADDNSAVPPISRTATTRSASRVRVNQGLIICNSPDHNLGLNPRRDLFYERDHHLAAARAISTPASGACRNCDIRLGGSGPTRYRRSGVLPRRRTIKRRLRIEKRHRNMSLPVPTSFRRSWMRALGRILNFGMWTPCG